MFKCIAKVKCAFLAVEFQITVSLLLPIFSMSQSMKNTRLVLLSEQIRLHKFHAHCSYPWVIFQPFKKKL